MAAGRRYVLRRRAKPGDEGRRFSFASSIIIRVDPGGHRLYGNSRLAISYDEPDSTGNIITMGEDTHRLL